jgi:hypothetical protein
MVTQYGKLQQISPHHPAGWMTTWTSLQQPHWAPGEDFSGVEYDAVFVALSLGK